jgi:KUP system potassium uptake protein
MSSVVGVAEATRSAPSGRYLATLSLAALGVVFGDIGTSPLYALRECLHGPHAAAPTAENVLGILSLVVWSLLIVVSLKYLAYVLRADNKGEGGILALMALASRSLRGGTGRTSTAIVLLGLFGAALLYGDGMITPAISVLSAVEGLEIATPAFKPFVVPLTIVILIALFWIQSKGTERVGTFFGPITFLWFVSLAVLGLAQIVRRPDVLVAVSPTYAVQFLASGGARGFLVLGAVFLVVTGGEALYADMGHFGARPIRLTWFALVLPSLVLNYLGQGALVLRDPAAASNPFFRMVPTWGLYPAIALSTAATIIASQALISGAFSLTRQALMLGYMPRVQVLHTSAREIGQVYVPGINWMLMLATIGLVLGFGSSTALAAAYGIAVTLTMVITTLLAYVVARHLWKWSLGAAVGLTLLFLVADAAFLFANLLKIKDGGWFPLLVGAAIFTVMTTWKTGRVLVGRAFREQMVPLNDLFELLHVERPARPPGTAVFMTSNREGTPPALLINFVHNRIVHQHVILLTLVTEDVARVADEERATIEPLEHGFCRVVGRFGFLEEPDVPYFLKRANVPDYVPEYTTFFLGRETVIPTDRAGMAIWRERLFAVLSRNAQPATTFYHLPPERVVELGSQIAI